MRSFVKALGKASATAPAHETPVEALMKLTIKLPPTVVDRINLEVARRKRERLPNRSIQAVVIDAVDALLGETAAPGRTQKAG
jgi:hypothetical protein